MKLFMLDEENGTAKVLGDEKKSSPFLSALDRVREEFEGMKMYDELLKSKPDDSRYKMAASQEFSHFLYALSDVLFTIKAEVGTGDRLTEFEQFIKELPR